jgi:hypothetical protein
LCNFTLVAPFNLYILAHCNPLQIVGI